jgi:hypothetical protein
MKNNLKNLELFSAYVANTVQNNTNGALTIINKDNSENNLELYIDNEFIASGFGFPDESAYTAAFSYINNLGNQIDNINDILSENIGKIIKNSSLEYTYTDNIFGQKYNEYGMPYSYNYFELTYSDNEENVSYTLNTGKKVNHNFIKNIDLQLTDNKIYDISENISLNLNIEFNNRELIGLEDYKLSCVYGDSDNDKYEINLSDLSIPANLLKTEEITIDAANEVKKQDVAIKIFNKYNDNNINDYYQIYNYVYKDFLSWKNKILYSNNYDDDNSRYDFVNEVNLNNSESNIDQNDRLYTTFQNIILNILNDEEQSNIYYGYDEEVKLNFNNVKALYDYIFIDEDVNIDFYFNEIKSNQWIRKSVSLSIDENAPDKTYYIYQSPQKYIGEHTWVIKINKQ